MKHNDDQSIINFKNIILTYMVSNQQLSNCTLCPLTRRETMFGSRNLENYPELKGVTD